MPAAIDLQSSAKPVGGRLRISKDPKGSIKLQRQLPWRSAPVVTYSVERSGASVDSSCSSGSCSSASSAKGGESNGRTGRKGLKSEKISQNMAKIPARPRSIPGPPKCCDWITCNSDPVYISFHDEEWGVPVRDDMKLFELLVLSQALAELNWPAILHKRDEFRRVFEGFNLSSVASSTEKKLAMINASGSLLSEPRLRAIPENARQILKVQKEFGSFSNYCWSFVNHMPIQNGFRYARLVPVKTPKAELISRDLMQRGFRCVGPTVVYSFMQVAGMVNDHLRTCFRFHECNSGVKIEREPRMEEAQVAAKTLESS